MIGAIVPYFGGKRTLASTIVDVLGPHTSYFEPFCGSLAVLLAKPQTKLEVVNDMHGDIANLARVLASNRWRELKHHAERIICCEPLIAELHEELAEPFTPAGSRKKVNGANVRRATAYLAASWLSRNGEAGLARPSKNIAVRWSASGGTPGKRWDSVLESIDEWHARLRPVQVLWRDAFDVIASIVDAPETAVYIDPPYFTKSSAYLWDFADDDHPRLAAALSRFKLARVVVSYYEDERLSELYPGWSKRTFEVSKGLSNASGNGKRAVEVLLVNDAETQGCDASERTPAVATAPQLS